MFTDVRFMQVKCTVCRGTGFVERKEYKEEYTHIQELIYSVACPTCHGSKFRWLKNG